MEGKEVCIGSSPHPGLNFTLISVPPQGVGQTKQRAYGISVWITEGRGNVTMLGVFEYFYCDLPSTRTMVVDSLKGPSPAELTVAILTLYSVNVGRLEMVKLLNAGSLTGVGPVWSF